MHHLGSSLNLKTVSHFWHDFSLSSQKLTSPPRNPSVITCQIRRASETPLTCELYDATQTIKQNTYLILPVYISSKLKFKNNCNFSEAALQKCVLKSFETKVVQMNFFTNFFILQKFYIFCHCAVHGFWSDTTTLWYLLVILTFSKMTGKN